ncbi:MAG: helix-turn-helix domain-containing protein, partial [Bacteroidales bacterium]|nr:helix-turn-helix domain-containing protein [Bacteroidales bacterium]
FKDIHIGSIIKEKWEKSSMTVTEFAEKINYHRTSVYYIFDNKTIDIELLITISEVLNYDFIHEIYFKQVSKYFSEKIILHIELDKQYYESLNLNPEKHKDTEKK